MFVLVYKKLMIVESVLEFWRIRFIVSFQFNTEELTGSQRLSVLFVWATKAGEQD